MPNEDIGVTSNGDLSILADWDRSFPGIPPVGCELRAGVPDRWVRFHSLPGSKRYPGEGAEYVELLARHNTILGELARPKERLRLVTSGYSNETVPTRSYPDLLQLDPHAKPWLTIKMDDDEDDPIYWHFFASHWEYEPGAFDSLVRLVADEIIANVLIVASDYRWVLHPYDGGMDVIAESAESRNLFWNKYGSWLSASSDGLSVKI